MPDTTTEQPARGEPGEARLTSSDSPWTRLTHFFMRNAVAMTILVGLLGFAGLASSPFRWDMGPLPRQPVAVDAIPDIGENQQIVFTEWPGRSPRDVEDQVSYPLTTALLGIPGVRTVRSFSMFGFSTVYVIFEDDVEFYWSRSRILEKLASLPQDTLPKDAAPTLGPDATALGQVYWYTLEGRDEQGNVVGGWDLHELRSVQDFTVRYALQSVAGVSEVSSVGGYVREYQVDVDSEALLARDVTLQQVASAVRQANLDVGARTLELNRVEYVVRGVGFVKNVEDLEEIVVKSVGHTPIRLRDVAKVQLGPAARRGALDKNGAPVVGGVAVARFGANPMEVVEAVQARVTQLQPSLPKRVLDDGRTSQITIVPFYDRSQLIGETLGTLSTALLQQLLITVLVVLVMLRNLRSSLLISGLLPLGVLAAFLAMNLTGVDANIMALSGIAISIGTMVDLGIVTTENIVQRLDGSSASPTVTVSRATGEVAPAIVTSTLTTILGFLPVFGLTAAEGKLFIPLALTKTFAMTGALVLALTVLPVAARHVLVRTRKGTDRHSLLRPALLVDAALLVGAGYLALTWHALAGVCLALTVVASAAAPWCPAKVQRSLKVVALVLAASVAGLLLADNWLPLGAGRGLFANRLFVACLLALVLGCLSLFGKLYPSMLRWCLRHKAAALIAPICIVAFGFSAWLGAPRLLQSLPQSVKTAKPVARLTHAMPGFGREYMPSFDEGSFLYMPTVMPHASIGEAREQLARMDAAIARVPEVEFAVGKLGRAESALDPAPISMFETVVSYKPEYKLDGRGQRALFRYDDSRGDYSRDAQGALIADPDGRPFRQWRQHIRGPDDIWEEVTAAARAPGVTSAPKLMPIAARIVMLQSGMRAPLGIKIRAPSLEALETAALRVEAELKKAPGVNPPTVVADRIVGKPYLEVVLNRREIARHGISVQQVQQVVQTGIGGVTVTRTVEGRERYPVRVRYMREERGSIETLKRTLIPSPLGHQLPLEQLADLRYVRGPQVIKSEDTFLTAYVVFDKLDDWDEVGVVDAASAYLQQRRASGELQLPEKVSYSFAGSYENQMRSEKTLQVLVPLALVLIFLLIYLQFRSVATTLFIFSGVAVAMGGGFALIWLYNQPWFLDFTLFGVDFRSLLQVRPTNLSVAVWVGFIALVGIATDDGVVMATYLKQRFGDGRPETLEDVRALAVEAASRRARACLMTTATTLLALLPVLTSTGRGSDVMVPMTLPLLGGMAIEVVTLFVIPLLYCAAEERRWRRAQA